MKKLLLDVPIFIRFTALYSVATLNNLIIISLPEKLRHDSSNAWQSGLIWCAPDRQFVLCKLHKIINYDNKRIIEIYHLQIMSRILETDNCNMYYIRSNWLLNSGSLETFYLQTTVQKCRIFNQHIIIHWLLSGFVAKFH